MSLLYKLFAICGGKEYRFRHSDASGFAIRAGVGMFLTVGPLVIMTQRWYPSAKPLTSTRPGKGRVSLRRQEKSIPANDDEPEFRELLQSQTAQDYPDESDRVD